MRLAIAIAWAALLGCGSRAPSSTVPAAEEAWDLDVDHAPRTAPGRRAGPAPSAAERSPPARPRASPRFRGRRIDIDLKGAELHDVFRLLSDVSGANIVVSDEVKGRVTLRLRRVPWDQVLHTVVAVKRLVMIREHGVYRIMSGESRR